MNRLISFMFSVHYRFRSQRPDESSVISFDGPFISLGELKTKIIAAKNLGSRESFDLEIVDAQTNEGIVQYIQQSSLNLLIKYYISRLVYSNRPDNFPIPKNTSVIVARVPLAKTIAPASAPIEV